MQYFIWFWLTVIRRAFSIIAHRKRETRRAYKLLDKIESRFHGRFYPATRKKIAISYGIYLPMLCKPFIRLHNRRITAEEKKRFIYYFICSSLFDDFTDYHLISKEQLYDLSFKYDHYQATTFDERVFLHAHKTLRDFVKNKEEYDSVSHALYEAQLHSQLQHQSTLSFEELKEITFNKGGYSVLLCSHYLNDEVENMEYNCWYKTGAIIQLTNDLYDIHKDLQDEITTLPDSMKNVYEFEKLFTAEVNKIKQAIHQLPFSISRKKDFSLSMAGIFAFGFIAIHRLKEIQGNAATLPDLKSLKRKQLIIDMEKISNLSLWFKYAYRHGKLKI